MKLRAKILLPVALTLAGLIALLYPITAHVLYLGFEQLVQERGRLNAERVLAGLSQMVDEVSSRCADWAIWDETYKFVEDVNPAYVQSNLPVPKSFTDLRVDLMLFVNREGRVVYSRQLEKSQDAPVLVDSKLTMLADPQAGLISHDRPDGIIKGLILTPQGPMVVCSRPIVHSDGQGPMAGALIFGRFLDAEVIEKLAHQIRVKFSLCPLTPTTQPTTLSILSQLTPQSPILVQPFNKETLASYAKLDNIKGEPIFLIRTTTPRYEYRQGVRTLEYIFGVVVLLGLVCILAVSLLLEKLVINRLVRLANDVVELGASNDPTKRVSLIGRDELAAVARRINTLLDDRQESEQELHKLARVAARTSNAVVVTDALNRVEWVNDGFTRMTGYSLPEVLGKTPGSFLYGDETDPQTVAQLEDSLHQSRGCTTEMVNYSKTGRKFWVSVEVQPIHDQQGRLTHFMSIRSDITERKLVQEALADVNARMRDVLDSATMVSIVATDKDGVITLFNRGAEEMLGYSALEMVGEDTPLALHDPAEIKAIAEELSRTATKPVIGFELFRQLAGRAKHEEREWTYLRKDGQRLIVTLGASALHDPAGNVTGYLFLAKDVTQRMQAEAQLREAKRLAEAASKAKSEFLANMSHEIRTPMNGIMGMTELALNTELTPEQREYLELVKRSADALLILINDILDFSKIEAGRLDLERTNFHLRNTLADTVKSLAVLAHKKGLELLCRIQPEVPNHLVGDSGRLRQILVNLINNAIKFTEQGEVEVTVEREKTAETQAKLHFTVRDTGIGIPPEKLQLIFEAFTQADSSITRQYGGTGLGLTISSRLVHLMEGQIWAESEVGQGSMFHFTVVFDRQSRKGTGSASSTSFQMPDLFGLSVLVVDDNPVNRRILQEMLTNWKMVPTVAPDGPTALAAMHLAQKEGRPYQLVLLDADMPNMSGFDLAAEMKKTSQLVRATVMMLSSADRKGESARCRELGIAKYLVKPITQSDLWDAIVNCVILSRPLVMAPLPKKLEQIVPDTGPLKILLAEDNEINQKLVVRMLGKMGHQVHVASTGEEVLHLLETEKYDVALMDVQMPIMDGFSATAAIREREKTSGQHLPIIAMTAHAMKGDRERCLAAGMDGYLSKPVMPRTVAEEIGKLIKKPSPEKT